MVPTENCWDCTLSKLNGERKTVSVPSGRTTHSFSVYFQFPCSENAFGCRIRIPANMPRWINRWVWSNQLDGPLLFIMYTHMPRVVLHSCECWRLWISLLFQLPLGVNPEAKLIIDFWRAFLKILFRLMKNRQLKRSQSLKQPNL